jgi:hypothetical protein
VRVTDSVGNTFEKALTISVTDVNEAPVVTSALTATPNAVKTGATVTFAVAGSDPENAALTTTFNYGDGSTGSGATHVYTATGTFTVTATISDGVNSVTSSATVTVASADLNIDGQTTPMDTDTDGDGFPDNIETALGTSPNSAASTPTGAAGATFIKYTIRKGKLRTNSPLDRIMMKGILHIPAGLALEGQKVVADAGGNVAVFTLNSQGFGTSGESSFGFRAITNAKRDREANFVLVVKGELLATLLQNSPKDSQGRPTLLSANIYFNGQLLNSSIELTYRR